MFNADSFRRVFDAENRKGKDLVSLYFDHLVPLTLTIKDKVGEIRELRKKQSTLKPDDFNSAEEILKSELTVLKAEKSAAIDLEMEKLSVVVAKSSFKLNIVEKVGPKGKKIYILDGTAETFFVGKQLQYNINRIYGVKQANRHDLACQLRDTIKSRFLFEIVRTDISSFYESIDRKRLFSKLDADQLLSASSKKFIKQIFEGYFALTGSQKGIPRGIGISAYLAELFLRKVDRDVKSIPGLVLYCRYVDDIVAVFARPPSGDALGSYKDSIVAILNTEGLTHNAGKTNEFNLALPGIKTLDYLGYRFSISNGAFSIAPSDAKLEKLKLRLESSFDAYDKKVPVDPRNAFREIVARIKYLTGNTRLANSKSTATTGIYYNNPIAENYDGFRALDAVLKKKINQIKRPKLRQRLLSYKFTDGFISRRFHHFSAKELTMIVEAWKHG